MSSKPTRPRPAPLPKCPVCGKEPVLYDWVGFVELYCLAQKLGANGPRDHEVSVAAKTQADAKSRWRRLCGEGKR